MKKYTILTHDRNGFPIEKQITTAANMKDIIYALRKSSCGSMYGTTWIYRNYANGKNSKKTLVQG